MKKSEDITPEGHSDTSEVTVKVHLGVSFCIIAEMLHPGEIRWKTPSGVLNPWHSQIKDGAIR